MSEFVLRLWIQNFLLKTTGQAFEDMFTEVAKQHWGEDFEPWKPQGRLGDFKCDGYQVSTQTVFQCFGPQIPDPAATSSKIQRDFDGAKQHFVGRMNKWVFVYNQRELPAASGKLLGDLREQNPGIQINAWLHDDFLKFAMGLSPESRAIVFPMLLADHEVSRDELEAMSDFVRERTALGQSGTQEMATNQVTLEQALNALSAEDREVRMRILGYCKWLDPLPLERGRDLLMEKGYSEDVIAGSLSRLQGEGLIKLTRLHILPVNKRVCAEAAGLLSDEFIALLAGD